ncbi:SDR family NAD(P)-dependent oxidoreductase [Methylocapsa acidiphila]|uniref:SDR family NAD(P)-dependent oxidoreductase n=1 Tax=Methylocapsa acidiphila TaxID=133552 RepID=UPI0003F5DAFA|nr:SDR family NAD(P)-dependent oxidoreductase [Methylocapsa acidiphila]
MEDQGFKTALIVGAGSGLSAALARLFTRHGLAVGLAARDIGKLAPLAAEIRARTYQADASDPAKVADLFSTVEKEIGPPEVVVYNAAARVRGPLLDLDPRDVARCLSIGAFGGFLVAQQAARRMIPRRRGAIFFTGASASVKGYPQSAPFAMGKFALRGLAQSLARELAPQGIHVAHFVIDGAIRHPAYPNPPGRPDSQLDPEAIAQTYFDILMQPRSAWTWEIELRPWVEKF